MVTDDFYCALEDRFRGSRDLIKARQKAYLPVVEAILKQVPKTLLDVGCGRAEWLELLTERGLNATGIDLNDEFVLMGRQAGLSVTKGEAIEFLSQQADQIYGLVSAFHVVEHLGFEKLLAFFNEAYRVLDSGGALLLETPNPANLVVGACNFYLDPTHERPIPSVLLSFVAEFSGFEKVIVVPVNRDFIENNLELLPSEFAGAGVFNKVVSALDKNFMQAPDYAVIAFKKADNESIVIAESMIAPSALPISEKETEDVNALFARLLESETERVALEGKLQLAATEVAHALENEERASDRVTDLQRQVDKLQAQQIDAAARVSAAEASAYAAHHQVYAMLHSTSWRVSSPVRAVGLAARSVGGTQGVASRTLKLGLRHGVAYVQCRPLLRQRVANLLARFPRLRARIVRYTGLQAAQGVVSGASLPPVETIERMTARGRAVYLDLLSAKNSSKQ